MWMPTGDRLIVRTMVGHHDAPTRRETALTFSSDAKCSISPDESSRVTAIDLPEFRRRALAQVIEISARNGVKKSLLDGAPIEDLQISPNGRFALLKLLAPDQHDCSSFEELGSRYEVASLQRPVDLDVSASLLDAGAIGWRPDTPDTLYWLERFETPASFIGEVRERLQLLPSPFRRVDSLGDVGTSQDSLTWISGRPMLLSIGRPNLADGQAMKIVAVSGGAVQNRLLRGVGVERPELENAPGGGVVVSQSHNHITLFSREGAEGGAAVDRLDLGTLRRTRVFETKAASGDIPLYSSGERHNAIVVLKRTSREYGTYALQSFGHSVDLARLENPYRDDRVPQRLYVRYERVDGVPLAFTLYLPPDYHYDRPLPGILWAYPHVARGNEDDVGRDVTPLPFTFSDFAQTMALYGYAVIDDASMPIVREPGQTVTDAYEKNVIADASAAVGKAVSMGILDGKRVAVSGYSYGANMAAFLLTRTSEFAAGIALSGSYNRTLTPLGFQNERRSVWQAPEAYTLLSPLLHANDIKAPLLLIHGLEDSNPGTQSVQAMEMYSALRGLSKTVRLVYLQNEGHRYKTKESVATVVTEMRRWLDKYVKPH